MVRPVLVLGLLAACSHDPTGGSVDGAKIFAQVCATCHGERGKPPEAMVARLGVKDLTAPALRAKITPAYVEKQVRNGSQNKLMPAFDQAFDDSQIKAIAAYVASPDFVK